MNQMYGHPTLDFSSSAVKGSAGRPVEMKVCEGGLCGGLRFVRDVPKTARQGVKICPRCTARIRAEQVSASRARKTPQQHWQNEMSRLVM